MLTVGICTYNRSNSLCRTLKSLSCQRPLGLSWELLVVDNNSTDDSRAVTESFGAALPLRYLFEPVQGLSVARNRTLREAKGDLVIFTDDDVEFSPGWLAAYVTASQRFPEAAYFGGPIRPMYRAGRPHWLRDESLDLIAGILGFYNRGERSHLYEPGEPPPGGANFALRRSLFAAVPEFRQDLGVKGREVGRGEETAYFAEAARRGSRGAYVADAGCLHWFDQDRLQLTGLYQYGIQSGLAVARTNGAVMAPSRARQLSFLIRGLYQLVKGRGDRFRQCVIQVGIDEGFRRTRQ